MSVSIVSIAPTYERGLPYVLMIRKLKNLNLKCLLTLELHHFFPEMYSNEVELLKYCT